MKHTFPQSLDLLPQGPSPEDFQLSPTKSPRSPTLETINPTKTQSNDLDLQETDTRTVANFLQSNCVRCQLASEDALSALPIPVPSGEAAIVEEIEGSRDLKLAVIVHRGIVTVLCYSTCCEFLEDEKSEALDALMWLNERCETYTKAAISSSNGTLTFVQVATVYAWRSLGTDWLALIQHFRTLFHSNKSLLRQLRSPLDAYTSARRVFTALGYRHIRDIAGSNQFLVIAKAEDPALPDPIQTFPVKVEPSSSVLTLRILFSHNNAVASFEKSDFETLIAISLRVNELIGTQVYVVEREKLQVHCCQRLFFPNVTYKEFSEALNQSYTCAIETYIWTCQAFYQYYRDRRKSAEDCLAYAQQYNPSQPTEHYTTCAFQSSETYRAFKATARRLEQEAVGPTAAGLLSYDDSRWSVDICRPKSVLSLAEVVSQGGVDLLQLCEGVEKVTAEYRKHGVFITPDMAFIGADFPVVRVIPTAPFPTTAEEAAVKSYQFFLKTANSVVSSSSYIGWSTVNCEGMRDLRWTADCVTGELCGKKVRGILCTDATDITLPAYFEALRNCEKVLPAIGISTFSDPESRQIYHLLMHEYGALDTGKWPLSVVKSVGSILQSLHSQGKAHGFLSEFTVSYIEDSVRLVLPCVYPAFFSVVNALLAERPRALLAPNLQHYAKYSVPPGLADLQAADAWALARLTVTHCLSEIGNPDILLEVNRGLADDVRCRATLDFVVQAIEKVERSR